MRNRVGGKERGSRPAHDLPPKHDAAVRGASLHPRRPSRTAPCEGGVDARERDTGDGRSGRSHLPGSTGDSMSGTAVHEGDQMPPIEGETQSGHLKHSDFRGSKHVVLWSYPMDDTPG